MNEEKIDSFLNSYDFMRLGQAISRGDQNVAMMILTHLQKAAEEADLMGLFDMNFKGLRGCILGRDMRQAQDILAVVTAKRVDAINKRVAAREKEGTETWESGT